MAAILPTDEPTLEDIAPEIARRHAEAKRQLPLDILLTLVSGGIGGAARVTAQQASRGIVRQALSKLGPTLGRKGALKQAREHLRGVAVTPKEYLAPFKSIDIADLPKGVRARFIERAKRGDPLKRVSSREVLLSASEKPSLGSMIHEAGAHYPQSVPQSPRLKTLLKPLAAEDIAAKASGRLGVGYKSLGEKHAREFTRRATGEATKGGKIRRLTKQESDRIFEASLRAVLESSGWVP